ncbi:MAG: TolC family protein [Verrucomicrobia bacterium]|nr:TolC family protein [Verrucomicrobiota bacterium]MCG2679268.1 TolC family protein [Kiritimatiellia bacterium]MBU4247756.1 TolC family protein [Verrucomicrobiota bacterium]MBU4290963.1 TolC family protein [Verrucomicrobiota bacterium]MBU4430298.1 TolC family protein [Verrucomicrobiota bacterium]
MNERFIAPRMLAAAIGLAGVLAGCMSAPAPKSNTEPWVAPERARQADATWQAARARSGDFSKPLALGELADIALRNNPASRKAWNDARTAAAQVDQARGYFLPTLTGMGIGARQGFAADPVSFDTDYIRYGPGLQLDYLVLNFGGGRGAAVEQALQTVYAANFTFNQAIQDILLAVETTYYGLVSAKAGVEAAEASVKDAKLALDTAQERNTAGVGTVLDVLQAQAGYDQARYQQAGTKGQLTIAKGRLAQALGLPADTPVDVQSPASDLPEGVNRQDMRRLIDEALDRRPDIAALRASLAAKRAAITVAGSAAWPSLFLSGDVNRNYYNNYSDQDWQDNDWSYNAGINLQWTLFDGLRTISAKRAAAAQADAARDQLAQAELAASAGVWSSYAAYDTALEKHVFSLAYRKSASASYDLALDSYRNGLNSMLDVISAESRLAQARQQNITARQDAFTALAYLAYAVGRLEKSGVGRSQDLFSTRTIKDQQP